MLKRLVSTLSGKGIKRLIEAYMTCAYRSTSVEHGEMLAAIEALAETAQLHHVIAPESR